LPRRHGLLDWDCVDAISVPAMQVALEHVRATGTFPVGNCFTASCASRTDHGRLPRYRSANPRAKATCQTNVNSIEDLNSVGKCPVSEAKIDAMKAKVADWARPGRPGHLLLAEKLRLCLIDGFLLYTPEMESVMRLMDVKAFLLVSRAKATQRREARDGYVTLEGFWKDPPGYVDKIVWPNYVAAHAWLFEDGDVEGVPDKEVMAKAGISTQYGRGLDIDMETTLEWLVDLVMGELEKRTLS
jgi:nicotinamide/nicotinate riboside kinase